MILHHELSLIMLSINGENKHYGTPINPRAKDRVPGGSSSGSAVSVAAELVDFSIGETQMKDFKMQNILFLGPISVSKLIFLSLPRLRRSRCMNTVTNMMHFFFLWR